MKSLNKTQIIYIVLAVISIVTLFFDPSISLGLILGFVFCILNLKLVYKTLDGAFEGKKKLAFFTKTSVLRFALLAVFIYLAVVWAPYFHLLGITVGMFGGMLTSIIERKKVS